MRTVTSEIACDVGLLLAGGGIGTIGSWSIAVSSAAKSAGFRFWATPMYLGFGLILVGSLLYILGKTKNSPSNGPPSTIVNNFYFAGVPGSQPATTGTGQDIVAETWLPAINEPLDKTDED